MMIENYSCLQKIANGSNSTVYSTKSAKTLKEAVLKIAPTNDSQINNEYQMLSKLHHRGIIDLIDYLEKDYQKMLVLEKGRDFFELILEKGPLSENVAKNAFRSIFEAVKFIHSNKVIHRDIKLENMVMMDNHELKLIDFGLALNLKDKSKVALCRYCGTSKYCPPEMILGMPPDSKLDIWSLGITLYAAVTALFPFDGEDTYSFQKSVMTDEPDFDFIDCIDNSGNPISVSKQFKDLICGMLQKDPKKRFSIDDCLNHPWFTQNSEMPKSSN